MWWKHPLLARGKSAASSVSVSISPSSCRTISWGGWCPSGVSSSRSSLGRKRHPGRAGAAGVAGVGATAAPVTPIDALFFFASARSPPLPTVSIAPHSWFVRGTHTSTRSKSSPCYSCDRFHFHLRIIHCRPLAPALTESESVHGSIASSPPYSGFNRDFVRYSHTVSAYGAAASWSSCATTTTIDNGGEDISEGGGEYLCEGHRRGGGARPSDAADGNDDGDGDEKEGGEAPFHRLSKVVASCLPTSRRDAESLIREGAVSVAGEVVSTPYQRIEADEAGSIKVNGRRLVFSPPTTSSSAPRAFDALDSKSAGGWERTRVWLVHKLPGELVTEHDPLGRPSMMDRLRRGGVGKARRKKKKKKNVRLIPVGRLDMATEGLILVTNDGAYARRMELPSEAFHRTYRARVHGHITESKLRAVRRGFEVGGMRYGGMEVQVERAGGSRRRAAAANTWLRITCREGKNRQIRKIMDSLGLKVTRLIRISFGDYRLDTIPPGMAIEVPSKPLNGQKRKGRRREGHRGAGFRHSRGAGGKGMSGKRLTDADDASSASSSVDQEPLAPPVEWVRV